MENKEYHVRVGDIVAFKSKKIGHEGWFTGKVEVKTDDYIRILISMPVEPQFYDSDDFTVAYSADIEELLFLDHGTT